jgi:endonuclease/exonuclease/phosphatase family metal-dependent hydrolase
VRKSIVALIWALILLAALGLMGAFVPPTSAMSLAILAVVLPAVYALLIPCLFVCAVTRHWVPFGLAAAIVLVVTFRHFSPERLENRRASEDDLVLMTYNAPRYPDDQESARQVTSLLARTLPDVMALQETTVWTMHYAPDVLRTHKKFRAAVDSLGYRVKMPPEGGPENARYSHWRPPVLLRVEPESQQQIELTDETVGEAEQNTLRTQISWMGRDIAIYNIHLMSHGTKKPWKNRGGLFSLEAWKVYLAEMRFGFTIRRAQVEKVRSLLDAETLPTILIGDFNSTPDSWTYRQLSVGMQDAFRVAGTGWGATYHANRPLVRIDFILVGPEFDVIDASVAEPFPSSSDHRPLLARVRWREETK